MKNTEENKISEPFGAVGQHLRRVLPDGKSDSAVSLQTLDIPMQLSGSAHEWQTALLGLGFTFVKESGKKLELQWVESLDINKNPHHFIAIILAPDNLRLQYTQDGAQHPLRRKLQAMKLAFLTLSVSGAWPSSAKLHQQIAQAFSDALALISEDNETLRLRSERTQKQLLELQTRLSMLEAQREADSKRQLKDAQAMQSLRDALTHLQNVPDSVLDDELMEWLRSHDGQINVRTAAVSIGIAAVRVEDALNRLCKNGRVQRIG